MTAMKQLLLARISSKVAIPLQAAFMMRILSAPAGKLKAFSAGDLGTRVGSLYGSLKTLMNMILSIMLTAACSLICIIQMIYYAPAPAFIALAVTAILVVIYVLVIRLRFTVSQNRMTYHAVESGLTYALIDGMQKIILSGAEKRAFSVWARVYRNSIRSIYDPPMILKVFGVLTPVVLLIGTMGIYPVATRTAVPPSSFYAFLSSYAILTGAFTMISANAVNFADALPIFRMLKPVMDFAPEIDGKKEVVQRLRGNISLQNITFRYSESMPPVLENLSIEIRRGEYVGIVGTTGSGKSTIFRLLLGFEKPDHGEILYDGKKLSSLDVTSLRRKIGTVLQNGEVFQGTCEKTANISFHAIMIFSCPFIHRQRKGAETPDLYSAKANDRYICECAEWSDTQVKWHCHTLRVFFFDSKPVKTMPEGWRFSLTMIYACIQPYEVHSAARCVRLSSNVWIDFDAWAW